MKENKNKEKIGVILCHGFSGNTQSLSLWDEELKKYSYITSLPLLSGHGISWEDLSETTWKDWYKSLLIAYEDMLPKVDKIFLAGLSMGCSLSLYLASQRYEKIVGLILVNPAIKLDNKKLVFLPILGKIKNSISGIGNDVKDIEAKENSYSTIPIKSLESLLKFLKIVTKNLNSIELPILVFRSTEDHILSHSSVSILIDKISSTNIELIKLYNSYHVATLDYDKEKIFTESIKFIKQHSGE